MTNAQAAQRLARLRRELERERDKAADDTRARASERAMTLASFAEDLEALELAERRLSIGAVV